MKVSYSEEGIQFIKSFTNEESLTKEKHNNKEIKKKPSLFPSIASIPRVSMNKRQRFSFICSPRSNSVVIKSISTYSEPKTIRKKPRSIERIIELGKDIFEQGTFFASKKNKIICKAKSKFRLEGLEKILKNASPQSNSLQDADLCRSISEFEKYPLSLRKSTRRDLSSELKKMQRLKRDTFHHSMQSCKFAKRQSLIKCTASMRRKFDDRCAEVTLKDCTSLLSKAKAIIKKDESIFINHRKTFELAQFTNKEIHMLRCTRRKRKNQFSFRM